MGEILTGETAAERLRGGRGGGMSSGRDAGARDRDYGGGQSAAHAAFGANESTRSINVSLVDTHCHLDADRFEDEPVAALLSRAHKAGVERVVTIATDLESSRRAVRLATFNRGVWATVGVDPNDLENWTADVPAMLEGFAAAPRVVAIGEIGLDYHWMRSPRETQIKAFEAQLVLAERLGLPVVIHSRDADLDMESILRTWSASHPPVDRPLGVMHCYGGDAFLAERLVEAGFLISLCGTVTFKNNLEGQEVARRVPDSALVLETDAPFLAPHPFRGTPNEPAHVRIIAERVAEIRQTSLEAVAAFTSANAERLFGLKEGE